MIKLFKQIPIVTRSMILISLGLYLVNVVFYFMGIYTNDYLGLFQFSNEKFKFYQVLTFTFSHDVYPGHLIYNMVYLLIFSVQSELVLKKDFYKMILFTIFFAICGLQFFEADVNHIGLSIIGFSVTSYFILSKNSLDDILSVALKLLGVLFIFGDFMVFLKGFKNNIINGEFHSSYAHMIGVLAGFIFWVYLKTKKRA
jgi:hypothetical protein